MCYTLGFAVDAYVLNEIGRRAKRIEPCQPAPGWCAT